MTNEPDWENSSDNPRARYIVPNLDRALVMLELLSSRPEGINVSDLGVELKIPKNSAFRIAVTLENRGFLEKVENTKRYRLTPRLLVLGAMSVTDTNIFEKSIDVMRRLRDTTGETAVKPASGLSKASTQMRQSSILACALGRFTVSPT